MEKQFAQTTLTLIHGDITRAEVDAIVNAANKELIGGGGVDAAIRRAGGKSVTHACNAIRKRQGGCPTGTAVITTGGNLPAKYVIHTAGPMWRGGHAGEPELLTSCYKASLQLAIENKVNSIAFPSISTGIYGYPTDKAAHIALHTIYAFAKNGTEVPANIQFVLFDDTTYHCYVQALSDLCVELQ